MATIKETSQAKLKKQVIDLIKSKSVQIEYIELVNDDGQVPHPFMVVSELTGRSTLTIRMTDKKQAAKFHKARFGGSGI